MKFKYYIVITRDGRWGGGTSIFYACKNAGVINPRNTLKRGVDAVVHEFGNMDHVLTEDDLDPRRNGGLTYTDWKVGDNHKPWITQYGSVVYWQDQEKVEGYKRLTQQMVTEENLATV